MKTKLCILALLTLMISCKTYTISPENFKKQFTESGANYINDVKVNNPNFQFSKIEYQANSLKYLNVYDKKGSLSFMKISPSIEMRVTLKSGKRKIFYLDTVILENDTLKGEKSRMLGFKNKVAFNEIIKIEVQDGGKNYQYVGPSKEEIIKKNSDKIFDDKGEVLKSIDFTKDSIYVRVDKYKNFYYASCKFDKSHSEITFSYYLNNHMLELTTAREISPHQNEMWWINEFYIKNNSVFFQKSYGLTATETDTDKPAKYKDYQFNRNLNISFLKSFSFEVYNIIKNN